MIRPANLPDVIAVFPLPGVLLLPRARLPLHVFEPRYLAMLDDVLKTRERLIGMVQPDTAGGRSGLQMIGCAGRVTQFAEAEDGRYMITLSGISRFRVEEEVQGFTPYRRCRVIWDGFEGDMGLAERDEAFERERFFMLLQKYFARHELKTDWEALKEAEDEVLINSLAMLLGFSGEDKQALLEAPTLKARRETLVTLIEFALLSGNGEEVMQ